MFHSLAAHGRAVFPAAVALATAATLGTAAVAQPVATPAPEGSGSAVLAAPSAALRYRSAFEGYRPWTNEKPIPWKEANETVYRRGGWQAYAKESAGSNTAEPPSGSAHAPAGAQPGHGMPMPGMPGMAGAPVMKGKP